MKKFCTIVISAIIIVVFNDCSFAQDMSKKEVAPSMKHKLIEFKPNKKKCDLCVNLHPKIKSVQI